MALTEAQVVILYFFRIAIVSFNRVTPRILVQLGDNYEVNISSKETEALLVIVLKYGTVKSFTIRVRGVKFPKMSQNICVSLISKFINFEICSNMVTSTMMTSSQYMSMYRNQHILHHINNWKYTFN